MAPRSFWKGYLKLSLVTCPVSMAPATGDSERVRFHTLNRVTGNRVRSRSVDAVTGKPVEEDEEAKGYQTDEDQYVILEDDDLGAIGLQSTRVIDIETFVPKRAIGWVWYDTPHYLTPDDAVGAEAFSVIRAAMAATGTVGISRLVLNRRERAVMLEPRDVGIVLWTLRFGDELRDPDAYFGGLPDTRVDANLLSLMTKLIAERTRPWSPTMVGDPIQERLLDIIAAKKKGRRPSKAKGEPTRSGNVINIMDALRKSLAAEGKPARRRYTSGPRH